MRLFLILFLIVICGCSENNSTSDIDNTPKIFYRWIEDLSFPSNNDGHWCDIHTQFTSVSHSQIPNNPEQNVFYGPLDFGNYIFDFTEAGGGSKNINFELPEVGYTRTYTHLTKKFSVGLNRCVYVHEVTFIDELN